MQPAAAVCPKLQSLQSIFYGCDSVRCSPSFGWCVGKKSTQEPTIRRMSEKHFFPSVLGEIRLFTLPTILNVEWAEATQFAWPCCATLFREPIRQ